MTQLKVNKLRQKLNDNRFRIKEIRLWMTRIAHSKLTTIQFFKKHKVPFSKTQFYNYKKIYATNPSNLLIHKNGRNRKLTKDAEKFILTSIEKKSDLDLNSICIGLNTHFGITMSNSGVSRAIKRLQPTVLRRQGRPSKILLSEFNSLGGFELIVATAYSVGWPQKVAQIIFDSVSELKNTKKFKTSARFSDGRNRKRGRFTDQYNKRKSVRSSRFSSVTEKREFKNWQAMNIVKDSKAVISRKSLAVLSLPVVTSNGRIRSVNAALGATLKHLCGFNYKQNTISKYLTELKYLGISEDLLKEGARFWLDLWGKDFSDSRLICYYIDGNTKPIWSSKHVKKNKVTMLGRVMGCLEQVFIHDGRGHPIYFETYSGHAPVGKHLLEMFDKVEDMIQDMPGKNSSVCRALVLDSSSNSVATLRSFVQQNKFHYITPLDDNQWNERQVIKQSSILRYKYGAASLVNLEYELEDSKEKGYIVRTRAVKVDWDNGRTIVLLTSLPDFITAGEVVYSYFKRWPAQELQFKKAKSTVSLGRVAGYGKTLQENPSIVKKQKDCYQKLKKITCDLKTQLEEIETHELSISKLIKKERQIHSKTKIVNGKRKGSKGNLIILKKIDLEIKQHNRLIKNIESPYKKDFISLRKNQQKWLRLQGKEKVYSVDVELDQIMTYHRISLANLYGYFLQHYCNANPMTYDTFVYRLLSLPATIEETKTERKIILVKNLKDPQLMNLLEKAINKLNAEKIIGPSNKMMTFMLT